MKENNRKHFPVEEVSGTPIQMGESIGESQREVLKSFYSMTLDRINKGRGGEQSFKDIGIISIDFAKKIITTCNKPMIIDIFLPLSLIFIMFTLGIGLTIQDFKFDNLKYNKAIIKASLKNNIITISTHLRLILRNGNKSTSVRVILKIATRNIETRATMFQTYPQALQKTLL